MILGFYHYKQHFKAFFGFKRMGLAGGHYYQFAFFDDVNLAGNLRFRFAVQDVNGGVKRRRVLAQTLPGVKSENCQSACRQL